MGETVRDWRLLTLDKSCPDVHVLKNLSPFLLIANTSFLSCTSGSDWAQPKADCSGQTRPVAGPNYPAGPHPAELVAERVMRAMSKPVYLLNITPLSQLRKDGHPSAYGLGGHSALDCSHWCIAGVPDTWNQLLYAALISR